MGTASVTRPPVQPGEPAPEFSLPSAQQERMISLADYRGRAVLLALYRGLYCPLCRRHVTQLDDARLKLHEAGIETLGIFAAKAERARLYFRFRPLRVAVAADPELSTHRAYGLPNLPLTPEVLQIVGAKAAELAREQGIDAPPEQALEAANRAVEGYELETADFEDLRRHQTQFVGQFLIDRDGIVRWANIEGGTRGVAGLISYPTIEELVAAARAL
ncbi:MAG: redoxin domain-containing protein [Candidatus Rokubacteria bacterium]|nr:redoxin domain-containing protein [Candidatus Rokubacteria bacterium]